jgi:type IV secretory pathway VirB2 component (pilin)
VPDTALLVVLAVAVVGPAVIAAWRRELPSLQQFAVWVGGVALAFFALGNTVESLILDRILTRM